MNDGEEKKKMRRSKDARNEGQVSWHIKTPGLHFHFSLHAQKRRKMKSWKDVKCKKQEGRCLSALRIRFPQFCIPGVAKLSQKVPHSLQRLTY